VARLIWTQPCAAYRKCHSPAAVIELMRGAEMEDLAEMPAYVAAELIVNGWRVADGRWVCGSEHPQEHG
jgi:hypothetical protein